MNPNLIARSSYSFFQSLLSIEDIINFALKNNYQEVSLIEKNVLYSAYQFYRLALKNNLKPIIGLEVETDNFHKILIAKNYQGYKNLIKISSLLSLNNNENFTNYLDDLIIIERKLPINCYKQEKDFEDLNRFSSINNINLNKNIQPLLSKEDFLSKYSKEDYQYIKQIYDNVDLIIEEKPIQLPVVFGLGEELELNFLAILKDKLNKYLNDRKNLNSKLYFQRLEYEFNVIKNMKMIPYFLMVSDFINYAKEKQIYVGPGRGSAAGSLIVFLLKITTIDPLEFNLIFERFLNPKRVSFPDIDVDFEDIRREEVIKYIVEKYGYLNVASIITFQSYKAKLALKDSLRLFDISASEANKITKLMKDGFSLQENYDKYKSFRYEIETNQKLSDSFNYALKIENLVRQFSTHAAGLVIANKEIYNYVPIQRGYDDNIIQTQYSMNYLEINGLLKVDLLGLKNLSFLKSIVSLIKLIYKKDIILEDLNLNDPEVYKLFQQGKTAGIFQFESEGMINVLVKLKPDQFEDIVSATSLFRPGPIEQIPSFIKRKHGEEKIEYLIPEFEKILKFTYGIIVYQEQIIEIVQLFAGFSLADADLFRRAIGKKDLNSLKQLKARFFAGAKEKGYSEKTSADVYQLIEKFSNYGFNRSHAVSYSIISFQLAWLKVYYKKEFMVNLLNSVIGNKPKTTNYIFEAKKMGIEVVKPSINNLSKNYAIVNKDVLRIGLKVINGIGEQTIKILQTELKEGKFEDFIDFIVRVSLYSISKSNLILLIKAGALDEFGLNRNTMLDNLETIIEYGKLITTIDKKIDRSIAKAPIIKESKKENYLQFEIEAFGFTLEEHPFKKYKVMIIEKIPNLKEISAIENIQDHESYFAGSIISISEIKTKSNYLMGRVILEDDSGQINLIFWPKIYQKYINILKIGNIYVIKGKVDLKRGKAIIVSEIKEITNGK